MKTIFILLSFLVSFSANAQQAKGFLKVEAALNISDDVNSKVYAARCLVHEMLKSGGWICLQTEDLVEVPVNRLTAFDPGLYVIEMNGMQNREPIEIKAGDVTAISTLRMTVQNIEHKVPGLIHYKDEPNRVYYVGLNYLDPQNRASLERWTQYGLEGKRKTGGCEDQKLSYLELFRAKKVAICKDKKKWTVDVEIEKSALEIEQRYRESLTNPKATINNYSEFGTAEQISIEYLGVDKNGQTATKIEDIKKYIISNKFKPVPYNAKFEISFLKLIEKIDSNIEIYLPGKYLVLVYFGNEMYDAFPLNLK